MRSAWQKVKYLFSGSGERNSRPDRWGECQLDVKMPFVKPRPGRIRRRKGGRVRIMMIGCMCFSIPMVAHWAYQQVFFENQEFKLLRIEIKTDGSLAESQIAKTSGVKPGMDLMVIDIQDVRDRLEALPYVVSAQVSRELPDLIRIAVKERFPVAWLSCPPQGIRPLSVERGFLIDEKGIVFRCLEMRDEIKALPVIEALKIAHPSEGSILESDAIKTAIKMVLKSDSLFQTSGLQISEVRLKSEWAMECVYRSGMRATFSMYEIDRGLKDLGDIVTAMGDRKPAIATVNLVAAKNIPVTFAGSVDTNDFRDFLSERVVPKAELLEPKEEKKRQHLRSILKGG